MKACIIQPPYSRDTSVSDDLFAFKMQMLDQCDESADIIVLPECSDIPCATSTKEETFYYHFKYIDALLTKCCQTAQRCNAIVFVNALSEVDGRYRNTTYAIDQRGETVGKYFKRHLPPLEQEVLELDSDYTYADDGPYVIEIDGLRYGFLTCYDFYFYEAFARIARQNVDIIIGCSLQRSDSHDAIETMCRFLAYNTNAYVLRSSVSFSEDSTVCGASMAVTPYGKVLANMKGRFGMVAVDFDPKDKYYKPAGYGNPDAAHYEYIEYGRRPCQYRPAGSAIVRTESAAGYPRICARGGFSAAAPKNSMPAFGAAVALDVPEIEFSLWPTANGEIVSCPDDALARVRAGSGAIDEPTLQALRRCDSDAALGEAFKGLSVVRFEDILRKLSNHVIMNIRIKPLSPDEPYPKSAMQRILSLIRRYECEKHAYFTLESEPMLTQFKAFAPSIPVCAALSARTPQEIVDLAIHLNCEKVQLPEQPLDPHAIELAHAHGIRCTVVCTGDVQQAKGLLSMGFDTLLTGDSSLILSMQPKS